jgi:hypothetical protein
LGATVRVPETVKEESSLLESFDFGLWYGR